MSIELTLRNDEKLIWSSKDTDYQKLNKVQKNSIIILSSVMIVFLLIVAILVKDIRVIGVAAFLSLIPVLVLLIMCSRERERIKKYSYALTNQRAIVMSNDVKSYEYGDISEARALSDGDGIQSLYFSREKRNVAELVKQLTTNDPCPGENILGNDFAFCAIDNCVEIVEKLKPYLHVEDAVRYERYHEL